jgi:beta-ribofuranosylaminobenzene 5'-phosphate synthase
MMEQARAVQVSAPARLHLGFLDLNGGLGRRFGGLGLAIDQPVTKLVVERAPAFSADGADVERSTQLLSRLAHLLALRSAYHVHVESSLPAHAGLGSGTQLTLAIATGLVRLEGLSRSILRLGELVDRGARSAIGMTAFEFGGFVLDGGRSRNTASPPVLLRHPLPPEWRLLLILDRSRQGVHGAAETEAFARLPRFPESLAAHLCRLVLMRLLPGLIESDLAVFGSAVTEIQAIVGDYFAPVQGGGRWTSPAVGRLVERLALLGATGIGQSSWGPTGFVFVGSTSEAQRLYDSIWLEAKAAKIEVLIAQGRNAGATVEIQRIGSCIKSRFR